MDGARTAAPSDSFPRRRKSLPFNLPDSIRRSTTESPGETDSRRKSWDNACVSPYWTSKDSRRAERSSFRAGSLSERLNRTVSLSQPSERWSEGRKEGVSFVGNKRVRVARAIIHPSHASTQDLHKTPIRQRGLGKSLPSAIQQASAASEQA